MWHLYRVDERRIFSSQICRSRHTAPCKCIPVGTYSPRHDTLIYPYNYTSIPQHDAFALSSVTRNSSVDVNGSSPLPLPVWCFFWIIGKTFHQRPSSRYDHAIFRLPFTRKTNAFTKEWKRRVKKDFSLCARLGPWLRICSFINRVSIQSFPSVIHGVLSGVSIDYSLEPPFRIPWLYALYL